MAPLHRKYASLVRSGLCGRPAWAVLAGALISMLPSGGLEAQRATTMLRGHVVDSAARTIDDARIRILGSAIATTTADDGSFRVRLVPGRYLLRVQRVGYAPRTVDVEAEADTVDMAIVLTALPQQLPEVIVAAAEERYVGKLSGFAERMRTRSIGASRTFRRSTT